MNGLGQDFDIWYCPVCGRTISAPIPRCYEPNLMCPHYADDSRLHSVCVDHVRLVYTEMVPVKVALSDSEREGK